MSRPATLTTWELDWLVERVERASIKATAELGATIEVSKRPEAEAKANRLRELLYKLRGLR